MTYFIAYNPAFGNALVAVSPDPLENAGELGLTVEAREGDLPDLSKVYWVSSALDFMPLPEKRILTKLEFMKRFQMQERIAARSLAKSDAIVDDIMTLLDLAQEINLDDPQTQQGVGYLAMVGVLSPARAQEILS